MPFINLSHVVLSPAVAQPYIVHRTGGHWLAGDFILDEPQKLEFLGPVTVASEKELEQMPEGDRVKGAMIFHATREFYATRTDPSEGISDRVEWGGQFYRICQISPRDNFGYYKAVGVRMAGD